MFKRKVSPKLLTQQKVELFLTKGNIWYGKKEILAEDLRDFNEIDAAAFKEQMNITKVEIPSNIMKIGNGAFINCLRLKEVILPETIKSFGLAMFAGCFSLKKVNIPSNFVYIPTAMFADCSLLEEIQIPNNITRIGSRAFANCLSLKNILLPESVEVIKENAFLNCPSLSKGIFSSCLYYQAHNFGLSEDQFNTLNVNLKSKISNEYLFENKLIKKEEFERISEQINVVKFKPVPVAIVTPRILLKDKKEEVSNNSSLKNDLVVKTKKEESKSSIPVDQKHTVVAVSEYLDVKKYNYENRKDDWHKKAGHNDKQLVCWGCKDDDNWETILLDNNEHVCYYCWIKKPVVKKETKPNALVVKKSSNSKKQEVKKAAPKKVNGIEVTKKHVVLKSSEIEVYNYDKRRKLWHNNAGYSEKQLVCNTCKEKKHTSVLTDTNKHICYNCFIKKPVGNKKMIQPK